jgi:hemerythrin
MTKIRKTEVTNGVYWLEMEAANLRILCGCPADVVKHLRKRGLIADTQTNEVAHQTGPNAILLSDVLVQQGQLANLSEFPVMQMLYLQGLKLPGHPQNTGRKPLLIGTPAQLAAQLAYLHRGLYGLVSPAELMAAGLDANTAQAHWLIKEQFAFGALRPPQDLVDCLALAETPLTLAPGVQIARRSPNVFEVSYQGEQVVIDLNLPPGQCYPPPYPLGHHWVGREHFAVVHSGEGDGWNVTRPCMGSVLLYQGGVYLIDAGPNILANLNALGISVNEVAGVFHTHAHDDHFAGLAALARTDHRLRYYATPLVRLAVTKKLCALMGWPEALFSAFFDVQDLQLDQWNPVNGLEVCPAFSPHPVETNVLRFRVPWQGGHPTYAHLADIASLGLLHRLGQTLAQVASPAAGHAQRLLEQARAHLQLPAQLKKIDAGGGLIHGQAEDFAADPSDKLRLAHLSGPPTAQQLAVGSVADFGQVDVLVASGHNYLRDQARQHLQFYFAAAPAPEIEQLLSYPLRQYPAGTVLLKKAAQARQVYLVLTGAVAANPAPGIEQLPAGSFLGLRTGLRSAPAAHTYRAACHLTALAIPAAAYQAFVARSQLAPYLLRLEQHQHWLASTWLFGQGVSFPVLARLAQHLRPRPLTIQAPIQLPENKAEAHQNLYLVAEGLANLSGPAVGLGRGEFFGGETALLAQAHPMVATGSAWLFTLPLALVLDIPIVYARILATYEPRYRPGR